MLVEHSHHVTINQEVLCVGIHIAAVISYNGRRSTRIHFLVKLIADVIHIPTSLQVEPVGCFQIGSQGGQCTVALIVVQDTVLYPIWVLCPFARSGKPALYGHITILVELFEISGIFAQVLSARETINVHQRIKVDTSGSRRVFNSLHHQVSIGVQFQTVIEKGSTLTQSQIVLTQLVGVDNTFGGRVGIREVSLQFLITGHHRNRVDSGHSIAEPVSGIIIVLHIFLFSPA